MRYKTKLCNSWLQTESCVYEENCQFAHGQEDLRSPVCMLVLCNGSTSSWHLDTLGSSSDEASTLLTHPQEVGIFGAQTPLGLSPFSPSKQATKLRAPRVVTTFVPSGLHTNTLALVGLWCPPPTTTPQLFFFLLSRLGMVLVCSALFQGSTASDLEKKYALDLVCGVHCLVQRWLSFSFCSMNQSFKFRLHSFHCTRALDHYL